MDRAGYFKKKGSTVDAKFARLHRRSIDQRDVRTKSFMDHRKLDGRPFSPLKEDRAHVHVAMPPPSAAPPKAAKKGNGANNKSMTKEPVGRTAAAAANRPAASADQIRREKLKKWKEERDMKKRETSNKKAQVFRCSSAIDRKAETKLFVSASAPKRMPLAPPTVKPAAKPAPVPTRATRSSSRSNNSSKDKSMTRGPAKHVEPIPSKRTRYVPPPPSTRPAPSKPLPASRAPPTRHSARIAAKLPPPPRGKSAGPTRGKKTPQKKPTPQVVEKKMEMEEEKEEEKLPSPVNDEPSINATFVPPNSAGFTFSMQLPDIPFTPISPASATNFMFPSAAPPSFTPFQRRCSTPNSMRTRKSLARTPLQDSEIKPAEDVVQEPKEEVAVETDKPAPEVRIEEAKPEPKPDAETGVEMPSQVPQTNAPDPAALESKEEAIEVTSPSNGEQKDVPYFKNLVSTETARLLDRCGVWEAVVTENNLSEEVCGDIRSTIGKAKLLIGQRFKQFRGLIGNCEFGTGEKATHCSDLEGFWEMVYFQVEDVDALFKVLEKLKANGWKKEQSHANKPKVLKKKKPVAKKTDAGAPSRNAARERLLAAKAAMKAKATRQAEAEKVVFEGGFFKVESPARKPIKEHCQAGSPFRTSRRNTPASRTATPKFATTPKPSTTPAPSSKQATPIATLVPTSKPSGTPTMTRPTGGTPTAALLFTSPLAEPRRSLRTRLCGEISKLALSDKKATPTRRTPARAAAAAAASSPAKVEPMEQDRNKENEVDFFQYLMPCMPVVNLNEQAEDLMVTEPDQQLQQLGVHSPKKSLRPRRSSVKPKDPFSPSTTVRSQALHNATNTMANSLCSPGIRKTRKSSLGFGLSKAASLFTPTSTPEPCAEVSDLISFD